MHKIKKNLLLASIAIFSWGSVVYAENCNSVITNQSNQPWTFKFDTIRGNVYFAGDGCPKNGPCVIPAHSSVKIEYTYNTMITMGDVRIRDYQGKQHHYAYYGKEACPRIERLHNDESISVNDPYRGSYIIVNETW